MTVGYILSLYCSFWHIHMLFHTEYIKIHVTVIKYFSTIFVYKRFRYESKWMFLFQNVKQWTFSNSPINAITFKLSIRNLKINDAWQSSVAYSTFLSVIKIFLWMTQTCLVNIKRINDFLIYFLKLHLHIVLFYLLAF